MSGGGSAPATPASPPPAPQPVDEGVLKARQDERRRLAAMYGRRASVLTGPGGASGSPTLGVPTLLGGAGS